MKRQRTPFLMMMTTVLASVLFSVAAFAQNVGDAGGAGTGTTGGNPVLDTGGDPGNSILSSGCAGNNMGNSNLNDSDLQMPQQPGTAGNSMGSTSNSSGSSTPSGNNLSGSSYAAVGSSTSSTACD